VGIQRNNDEERGAIVERLVQEHHRLRAHQPMKAALRTPDGPERREQPERRRGRVDAELRTQREALDVKGTNSNDVANGARHRENTRNGD
jgi:hypothetical protein